MSEPGSFPRAQADPSTPAPGTDRSAASTRGGDIQVRAPVPVDWLGSEPLVGPVVVAVVGPTASGKTALAVDLALALGAEVVNADAFSLYRGMDIGTAKPTCAERRGVPHHLLDLWTVDQPASVAEYQREARATVAEVRGRGRPVVVVGGSGLYVQALLEPLEFPGTDPLLRAALEDDLARLGPQAMHDRLADVDPAAASAILATNGRRVVRALEVVSLTGEPFVATLPGSRPVYQPEVRLGLDLPRDVLDERVDVRVVRMWHDGLLDEVRALLDEGLRGSPTASRALGYAQVIEQLDGTSTQGEAQRSTAVATKRLVRRQQRWFRRDPTVRWLDPASPDLPDRALAIVHAGQEGGGTKHSGRPSHA